MNYKSFLLKIMSAEVGAKFFLGLISIFSIRYMPVSEFGVYAFALSVFVLITSIVSSIVNIIYVSASDEMVDKFQASFFSVQLLFLIVVTFVLSPFSNMFGGVFALVISLSGVQFIFLYCQTYFQKRLDFKRYYRTEYIRVILFLVGFGSLVFIFGNSVSASQMILTQILATSIPIITVFNNVCRIQDIFHMSNLKSLLIYLSTKPQFFLLAYFCLVTLLLNIDMIILRSMSDTETVAEYGAAFRYYAVLQVALISIHKLLLPVISKATDNLQIKHIFEQHKKLSYQLILLSPVIYFGATYVIPLIDEGKYPASISIFLVLALSSYFSFCFSPYANVLIKFKEYRYMCYCVLLAVSLHLIIVLLMVNAYGAIGAAISNLISYAIFNFSIFRKADSLIKFN